MPVEAARVLHCWEQLEEWNEAELRWETGTCLLLAGHEGEHEFTPDSQIVIHFADEEGRFRRREAAE